MLLTIFLGMALVQPLLPDVGGQSAWLTGFLPVFLVYAAVRLDDAALVVFILVGGLLNDLLMLHYVGMGPLLWAMTIFLARSQRDWLGRSHWLVMAPFVFTASLFYMVGDRLFFLLYRGFWSWNLELSFSLLSLALINAIFGPLLLYILDAIMGTSQRTLRMA